MLSLTDQDVVVDLGCGTGQLTFPMAARVRTVVGIDPEPDMLQRARLAAGERDVRNALWVLGSDADIPAPPGLLGSSALAAVTVGQALHWMDHRALFASVVPLLRPGGGVAVVTNGTPLWLHDADWSRAVREFLEHRLATRLTSRLRYRRAESAALRARPGPAGFEVLAMAVDYTDELDLDQLVGGVYPALPVTRLPAPEQRQAFVEQIRSAVAPHQLFREPVHVAILARRVG
jgi:SAM-dependent methyltransferase